ncbi:MAG: guanylate kinase [Anaerolineae bacterium]|jgi:guanylate kinase|nr:guanylate kinase [Anaerolineae bacterium]
MPLHDDHGSGAIFLLVGPGGVGKNTLMQRVMPRFADLHQVPTATTRAMRPGEMEGREHYFIDEPTFIAWRDGGKLVEWEEVHPGKWYGVVRDPLEAAFRAGTFLIADVEMAGAQKVKAAFPDHTVLIFIAPPAEGDKDALQVLEERMRARGEKEEGIAKRMARAPREMEFSKQCQYIIVNDDPDRATEELTQVIAQERAARFLIEAGEQS